jgi:hypothetical protein
MSVKQQQDIQQGEHLSSDEVAFCGLIARILMRCLKENNPEVLKQLSLLHQEQQHTGESDVSAA